MTLFDSEQQFLARQRRGYLSTIGRDGTPQVKPLGFSYNASLGTVDISGFNMGQSAKYRNVIANSRVAFVVDEVTEETMQGVHFLEIRGNAEAVPNAIPGDGHLAPEIIRIHPTRVVAYNVDPERPGFHARNIVADPPRPDVA
jgi:pyridoxamine 5'-phosphate oxidase family protein